MNRVESNRWIQKYSRFTFENDSLPNSKCYKSVELWIYQATEYWLVFHSLKISSRNCNLVVFILSLYFPCYPPTFFSVHFWLMQILKAWRTWKEHIKTIEHMNAQLKFTIYYFCLAFLHPSGVLSLSLLLFLSLPSLLSRCLHLHTFHIPYHNVSLIFVFLFVAFAISVRRWFMNVWFKFMNFHVKFLDIGNVSDQSTSTQTKFHTYPYSLLSSRVGQIVWFDEMSISCT